MKGPRYGVGFVLAMVAWAAACINSWFLMLAAWLMDYEKELGAVRDEVDALYERQDKGEKCPMCGL